ncbi:MAG: DNA mismatch repair endonuclease MutL [Phycisphaerae bacterium]|nr:DNA mismatch repair endonuclease MutL [Phycisphaerae bacterium]
MPVVAAAPSRIRLLDPLVVNQIAAGEVVERPSSVVKELVENAIDAGAARIVVEMERGGIELVRVTDDGAGIEPDDLQLAIAQHATSKIRSSHDLERVATMGFRGEALASIASVSRLTLRSRTRAHGGAVAISVEGTHTEGVHPESGPPGTQVTVRNLFFNTPARRKFLRTEATEGGRCAAVVEEIALAFPAVGFEFRSDGRLTLDLPPNQDPRARALSVLGKELEPELLEVSDDGTASGAGVTLWGLAGRPSLARATTQAQHIYVNGRAVRDKTIQHAVKEAYRGLIEPGRHPAVLLMIDIDPASVDVNVHPAKAEVRFRDPGVIHSAVLHGLRRALTRADLTPSVSGSWGTSGSSPTASPWAGEWGRAVLPGSGGGASSDLPRGKSASDRAFIDRVQTGDSPGPPSRFDYQAVRQALDAAASAPGGAPPEPGELAQPPRRADRIIQVHNSYVVTEDEEGMVIIDQHALHERAMFEKLLSRIASGDLESQRLLAPVVVRATARQLERLQDLAPVSKRIGLVLEPIGPSEVAVQAFPTFLFDRGVSEGAFVEWLLDRACEESFVPNSEEALHEVLDMMACKAAIKAGHALGEQELAELLSMRDRIERSSNCPHGRPTSIRLSIRELDRRFGRS